MVQLVVAKEVKGTICALVVADEPVADVGGRRAIGSVALDIDALDPAAIDEVVDVSAAPRGRERRVHVGRREPERGEPRLTSMSTLRLATSGSSLRRTCASDGIGVRRREQAVARRGELLAAHAARCSAAPS